MYNPCRVNRIQYLSAVSFKKSKRLVEAKERERSKRAPSNYYASMDAAYAIFSALCPEREAEGVIAEFEGAL